MIFYEIKVQNIAAHPLMNASIEIALIMIISELSYRYIEAPLRHYRYRNLGRSIYEFVQPNSEYGWKRLWLIPAILLIGISAYGSAISPTKDAKNVLEENISKNEKTANANNKAALAKQKKASKLTANQKRMKKLLKKKLTVKQYKIAKHYGLNKRQYLTVYQQPLTAIGDSILADNSHDLQNVFQNAYVSAAVGRQIWQAGQVLTQMKNKNELAPNVLINLGTNSPMTSAQINSVIKSIGPKHQIFWVTTHVPTRNWETEVNHTIRAAAKRHKNMHIIDWHSYSLNRRDWFWNDNVHPNPKGNIYYTHLIATSISDFYSKK